MKIKDPASGAEFNVRSEPFLSHGGEHWTEYRLENGTIVKLKVVAVKIYRVLDEHGNSGFNPDGEPSFIIRNQTLISSEEPER